MATDPVAHRFTPRRIALLLAGILVLTWLTWWRLGGGGRRAELTTIAGPTMGTSFTVKVVQRGGAVPDDELQAIIEQELDRVNELMSTYDPDSEISRFNAWESTEPFPISPETAEVVSCALKVSEQTMGAFDVTLGPIVNAYGFGPEGRGAYPSDEAIEALRTDVGYDKIELDSDVPALRKSDPDVYIDLNAIAPGYAADRIAESFNKAGVSDYLIEVGGEVRARGHNTSGEVWRVGIEQPVEAERVLQRAVPLDGLALATSGDYREYYVQDDVRVSHTIDGRTGRPIAHNLASVSVIHEECMWADAYSTAIMALGPEDGYILAEILELPAMFILRGEAGFTERATPAFLERFGPLDDSRPEA